MAEYVGYVRVSTQDQKPDLQIEALKKAGCTKFFTDYASGTRENRPNFIACLDYLRSQDTLVVWKLDRLGRNAKHLIELMEELNKRNINFKSLTEAFDTASPMGNAVFTFMCAIAQMERDILVERTKAGLEIARKQGRRPGPKNVLNGSQIDQIKTLIAEPTISLQDIADQYGVHRTTIYRALKQKQDNDLIRK